MQEQALVFESQGRHLVGVLSMLAPDEAPPQTSTSLGVVIVVGGPQYRVGSHRQFVMLARRLAAAGHPTLRFDVRGMGDSDGEPAGFESQTADIAAAIDELRRLAPQVHRVVLWGLCDGASAALLYADERSDPRLAGLCLANPWVRSAQSQARANVKHYYRERLLQKEFWLKVLRGGVAWQALRGLWRNLALARAGRSQVPAAEMGFQARMARGWRGFAGPVLLIQSGQDHTAREFDEYVAMDPAWQGVLALPLVCRVDIDAADHTFSVTPCRLEAERATLDWLASLVPEPGRSGFRAV